jgi:predicted solute-binding protein
MHTIGCVSYLNAKPLLHGLDEEPGIHVTTDVPSRLLPQLLDGRTSVALCPTIDFQTASADLQIVTAGAIGSDGETLTVRVFSDRPFSELHHIAVDGDSRTSVALLQVVFSELFGLRPRLSTIRCHAGPQITTDHAGAVLLIGDKVITNAPNLPHQLDLGEAWKRLTGLPFVFAAWMTTSGQDLGDLPGRLQRHRDSNCAHIADIVRRYAPSAGWPEALAEHYLGNLLRYELGPRELESMTIFWTRCHALGLINRVKPLALYDNPTSHPPNGLKVEG